MKQEYSRREDAKRLIILHKALVFELKHSCHYGYKTDAINKVCKYAEVSINNRFKMRERMGN